MTTIIFPTLTPAQAQQLYDHLGTTRAVGEIVGASHFATYQWLRRLGVKTRKRGGSYGRNGAQRVEHWLENKQNGDGALRARPCKRLMCAEADRWCVMHDMGCCDACREQREVAKGVQGTSLIQAREMGIESAARGERLPMGRGVGG